MNILPNTILRGPVFPEPVQVTGEVKALFTKRHVTTTEFQISEEELDFYDRLTRYVEDQSIKAAADESARGRALGPFLFSSWHLRRRVRARAGVGLHDGNAPTALCLQHVRGAAQLGADARQTQKDPRRP